MRIILLNKAYPYRRCIFAKICEICISPFREMPEMQVESRTLAGSLALSRGCERVANTDKRACALSLGRSKLITKWIKIDGSDTQRLTRNCASSGVLHFTFYSHLLQLTLTFKISDRHRAMYTRRCSRVTLYVIRTYVRTNGTYSTRIAIVFSRCAHYLDYDVHLMYVTMYAILVVHLR